MDSKQNEQILPIILAGGAGSRLWPLSNDNSPKQFLSLVNDKTLLQNTLLRLKSIPNILPPLILCQAVHRHTVAEQIDAIDLPVSGILLEPYSRETAPAITMAALYAQQIYPDARLLIMPSDHIIDNEAVFCEAISTVSEFDLQQQLLFLASKASYAEEAYGYIKLGSCLGEDDESLIYSIAEFVEKPESAMAQAYVDSGRFVWNTGILMCKSDVFLQLQARYAKDILKPCELAMASRQQDNLYILPDKKALLGCPISSIQYLFQHHQNYRVFVMPDIGWFDVGSWDILAKAQSADEQGNIMHGDVWASEISNTYLHAEHRLVAAIGVQDHIIVETEHAVLVAHKSKSQALKVLVNHVKDNGNNLHENHWYPWGELTLISTQQFARVFSLKIIPQAQVLLPLPKFPLASCTITEGEGHLLQLGQSRGLTTGDTFSIAQQPVEIINSSDKPLQLIAVQTIPVIDESAAQLDAAAYVMKN